MNNLNQIFSSHQDAVKAQILKGFDGGLEKAHQVGEIKIGSDGIKRIWKQLPNGKFDWRRVKDGKDVRVVKDGKLFKKLKESGLEKVKLVRANGYFYITSDDDATYAKISKLPSTSIYVNSLNQLTTEQWVDEIKSLLGK